MKTTEIFVEQVLIGFMVLFMGILPFLPELKTWLGSSNSSDQDAWKALSAGVVVVGAAYLIGILFDRMIDTLLQDLDEHHRARYVLSELPREHKDDPFPEGEIRSRIMMANKGATVEWLEYLRTRIRLTRTLAVFLPGLAVAAIHGGVRIKLGGAPPVWVWGLMLVPGYIVFGCVLAFVKSWLSFKAPKTYDRKCMKQYAKSRGYSPESEGKSKQVWSLLLDISFSSVVLTILVMMAAFLFLNPYGGVDLFVMAGRQWLLVAIAGLVLAVLSGWAWWRISQTFLRYLSLFDDIQKRAEAQDEQTSLLDELRKILSEHR